MAKAMLFQNELGSGVIQNALKTRIGRKNAQVFGLRMDEAEFEGYFFGALWLVG